MIKNLFSLKKIVQIFGFALTIICLLYVSRQLKNLTQQLDLSVLNYELIYVSIISIILLLLSQIMIGLLLWTSLNYLINQNDPFLAIYSVLRSQIAKYLPSNIIHIGGTIAFLKLGGVPIKFASFAVAKQYLYLIVGAFVFGVVISTNFNGAFYLSFLLLSFVIFLGEILLHLLSYIPLINNPFQKKILNMKNLIKIIFLSSTIIIIFIILSSIPLLLLSSNIFPNYNFPFLRTTAAFSLAWVAGMVVIGAPGGLGIRETVFVFLTQNFIGESDAILLIAIHRIYWIISDILVFFIAPLLFRRKIPPMIVDL